MYIHFKYKNGSNPYITTNNKNLFHMICKYDLEMIGSHDFEVEQAREPYKKTFKALKAILRDFAKSWQGDFTKYAEMGFYGWGDVIEWGAFFEEYGKKYGLLREFRENGII